MTHLLAAHYKYHSVANINDSNLNEWTGVDVDKTTETCPLFAQENAITDNVTFIFFRRTLSK